MCDTVEYLKTDTHETVARLTDEATGLDAIVAVHSTALGPALGGCRQFKYESFEAHLEDALMLSEGMTYKNSVAGLDLGGGKTAINITNAKPGYLKALAKGLNVINADREIYYTAGDVGTSNDDLKEIAKHTKFVNGFEGSDSGHATAHGVFSAMQGALEHHAIPMHKATVAIAGLGKVGLRLAIRLIDKGAVVYGFDPNPENRSIAEAAGVHMVNGMDYLMQKKADVFAPCALGKAITWPVVQDLPARSIICGGANNQIDPADRESIYAALAERKIAYVPDFVANAGGVIIIAKRNGRYIDVEWDHAEIKPKLEKIKHTARVILSKSYSTGNPTEVIAESMAKERVCSAMKSSTSR